VTASSLGSADGWNVQLGLLGSFNLHIAAEPVRLRMDAQRLVAFLALHDGLLLREYVAGSLWGDSTERHAAGSLRTALWRLGHSPKPIIEAADPHLRLSPRVAVDFRASEALAHHILDDSCALTEADIDDALLSVDLLPDWTEDWVLVQREYHTQLRVRALEALCRRLSEEGQFGRAVQVGIMAVAAEPLRESAQRVLVAAHLAEGNVAAALKRYESFRTLLRDELKLDPSPQMQALIEKARR